MYIYIYIYIYIYTGSDLEFIFGWAELIRRCGPLVINNYKYN